MLFKFLTSLTRSQKAIILVAIDLMMIAAAYFSVLKVFTNLTPLESHLWVLPILLAVGGGTSHFFGLNRIKLNSFGLDDIGSLFLPALAIVSALLVLDTTVPALQFQPSSVPIFAGLLVVYSIISRFLLLKVVQKIYSRRSKRKKVLIYGAGQTGQQLAAALQTDDAFQASCFVDDDAGLHKLTIAGLRVFSPDQIPQLIQRNGIERVVLAMPSADQAVRMRIGRRLSGFRCEVLALPSFADIVLRGEESTAATPVKIDSLLGRDEVDTDLPKTEGTYRDQNILITGAGGSIGGELCRQIARCSPRNLVLLDNSEYALYSISCALHKTNPALSIKSILGSVEHPELMREVLQDNKIDIVFHAAAYKHVNLVEQNAYEAVRNNVLGTRVLAEEARRAEISSFILVSTDKAVRPTSVMGSTKRLAELVVQDLANRSEKTKFSIVRFGNVLGSSGSVIPLFQKQIHNMGPVTVTHPNVTRYFMTVDEAVRLVLLTGTFSDGGDVFVLDMGTPVSIYAMARKMIEASGHTARDELTPDGDIPIIFTGLTDGEKMHEELLIGNDMLTTPHPKILRAQENQISELEVASALKDLRRAVEDRDKELLHVTLRLYVECDDQNVSAQISNAIKTSAPKSTVVGEH